MKLPEFETGLNEIKYIINENILCFFIDFNKRPFPFPFGILL